MTSDDTSHRPPGAHDGRADAVRTPRLGPTEERQLADSDLDLMSAAQLLERLHREHHAVARAVDDAMPQLLDLVERASRRLSKGGCVHYVGAGTSGRLAALDAAEIPPTFGVAPSLFTAHLAGGPQALLAAVEGAEDDDQAGADVLPPALGPGDVVLGISASGRTPFVHGALHEARARGALTALLSANPEAPLAHDADVHVCTPTGPEALTGSTRLKAASAHKMVLNLFSTALMVLQGRVYSNLMINLTPTNAKLRQRLLNNLSLASGRTPVEVAIALDAAGGEAPVALVMLTLGLDLAAARRHLALNDGRLNTAIRARPAPA